MRLTFNPTIQYNRSQPNFTSNNSFYLAKDNNPVGTVSRMFREDLEWNRLALYEYANFHNTPIVQTLQFACSDGSESYTQAISLLETPVRTGPNKFLPIQAMDINDNILDMAKSGFVNFSKADIMRARHMGVDINKYFEKANQLHLPKNLTPVAINNTNYETYKVKPILTDMINFKKADMFEVMKNHKDNSNTIVMCRNVLGYFSDDKIEEFLELLRTKLNKNSLVVIGRQEADLRLDKRLLYNDFTMLTKNILKKIH